jgi:protease PrsW
MIPTVVLLGSFLVPVTAIVGVVLGAAVGFGFGALESSGYALNALFVAQGHQIALSPGNLVFTEPLRGILAPVGHGLWTAILGGALFSASRGGHLRFSGRVAAAYLLVAFLHALWDSMRGIAPVLNAIFTATPSQRLAVTEGQPVAPTPAPFQDFLVFEFGGFVAVSVIGLVILWIVWRRVGVRRAEVAV